MKKVFKYIFVTMGIIASMIIRQIMLILILIGVYVMLIQDPKMGGRDTVLSFGDGTYQVFSVVDPDSQDDDWQNMYCLENVIEQEILIRGISSYKIIKKENKVYFMGHQREHDVEYEYFILNYKTGSFKRADRLSEFNEKDQKVFSNKKEFKVLMKKTKR